LLSPPQIERRRYGIRHDKHGNHLPDQFLRNSDGINIIKKATGIRIKHEYWAKISVIEPMTATLWTNGCANKGLTDRSIHGMQSWYERSPENYLALVLFWPINACIGDYADSSYVIDTVAVGFALLMLIRTVLARQSATDEQRTHAWEIVQAYGCTPLARFTLFEDKLYFFSTCGSMIAYILKGRAAITLGDPIGPSADFFNCIVEFKEFCGRNNWLPVFYQVLPDKLKAYDMAGFDAICIGHDAIVDLSTFTLAGRESKNIRNSFHKMIRLGYKTQVCDPPHPPSLMHELNQISDEWLSIRGGFEIGFSLGQLDEKYLNTCPIILVRDQDGRAEALANIIFQPNEAIIDLMRYRPGSKNGRMDYLFVSVLQWAKERGLATFNLGFSPFSGIGEEPHSSAIERALRFIHEHLACFPNFKGLHFFKEKFNPIWSPRYLIYPGLTSLPIVAISVMRAYKVNQLISRYLLQRK